MARAALGVDLAARRWGDNGSALLRFDADRWADAVVPAIDWDEDVPLTAPELAVQIDRSARRLGASAVALDGPQGWRDPRRPASEGVGRACERAARTQGKAGVRGVSYPGSQRRWFDLAIGVFDSLLGRPAVVLANDREAAPLAAPPGGYVLVEAFPTSTWRTAGLQPLPGKRRAGDVRPFAYALARRFGLPQAVERAGHDDLQAVVAALAAAAVGGGPAQAVPRGVPAETLDGSRVEGLIWDAAPLGVAPVERSPERVLVVVNGPPAAGKTTVARALAHELALPLLSKDELKESLFDSLGAGDRAWSRRLGAATFELLFLLVERELAAGRTAVVEANFDEEHACPRFDALRRRYRFRLVEVHLSAPEALLRRRFAERSASGDRHPGHLDAIVAAELDAGVHRGRWRPLSCADELVEVDAATLGPATAARIAAALGRKPGRQYAPLP